MKGILLSIVGIVVGIVLIGALVPDYLTLMTNQAYTGAPAAVKTMATTVLGIVAVVALILIFIRRG